MSDPALRYAALIERPDDLRFMAISGALAKWKKVPAADTVLAARRCFGIAAEGEEQGRADALIAELAKAGIPALAVPVGLLEDPPAPVKHVGALPAVPGGRLALLAAAGFRKTTTKTVKSMEGPTPAQRAVKIGLLVAGIPVSLGGGQREVVKTVEESDLVFYADLVLKDPAERWRVDAQAFDYSCLGARKAYGALVNFRTLLQWILEAAPRAVRNRGTRYLLEGKPVREMGYEGLDDLEREERWLLTLAALKKL